MKKPLQNVALPVCFSWLTLHMGGYVYKHGVCEGGSNLISVGRKRSPLVGFPVLKRDWRHPPPPTTMTQQFAHADRICSLSKKI